MYFRIFAVALITTLSVLSAAFASKGGATSGGGNAVYTRLGELRLIDFLSDQELKDVEKTAKEAIDEILAHHKSGSVTPESNFFTGAIEKIRNSGAYDSVLKESWIMDLKRVKTTQIESSVFSGSLGLMAANFTLSASYFGNSFSKETANLKDFLAMFSPRIGHKYQITIAAYTGDTVSVQSALYDKLRSDEERVGTQVHEAVRLLGVRYRKTPFTTLEVEALTQEIMGITVQDQAALKSAHTGF